MSADVNCDAGRRSYRCDTQEIANDQPWRSGAWAKIEVVQTRASGHPLAQSGLTGCCSGQHGMSSAICIPGMALAIASIIAALEDAMALLANPMLVGPTMTASRATIKNRRWTILRTVMAQFWHAVAGIGSGFTEMCAHPG